MKANELMIGDWVFCTYPSIKKPFRVEEIRTVSDNELKIIISDELRLVFQERYIEPIPLTPEILEENGFKSWEHGYMWKERIGMGEQTTSASSAWNIVRCHAVCHAQQRNASAT